MHRTHRTPTRQRPRERLGDALLCEIEIPDRECERANDSRIFLFVPRNEVGIHVALPRRPHNASTRRTTETFTRSHNPPMPNFGPAAFSRRLATPYLPDIPVI